MEEKGGRAVGGSGKGAAADIRWGGGGEESLTSVTGRRKRRVRSAGACRMAEKGVKRAARLRGCAQREEWKSD